MFQFVKISGYSVACSLIALLAIAMPLKYMFELPQYVAIIGAIHGCLLFVYAIAILTLVKTKRFSIMQIIVILIVGMIPFGSLVNEFKLRKLNK